MDWKDYCRYEELNTHIKNRPDPMITVLCNVYNFAEYLRDAFEGIIMQETGFPVEILVIDDASTDGSKDIIREYCSKYPDTIHGFLFKDNVYGTLDGKMAVAHEISFLEENLRGGYAAYCEGDDYWIDPRKLKLQIEYMEEHPDCMMTMHDAVKVDYSERKETLMKPGEPEHDIESDELILQKTGIWPTASMVFRKEVALCPEWMVSCGVGDWPRQLYAMTLGKVHYFDRAMCVYRFKHTGSWSTGVNADTNRFWSHAADMTAFLRRYSDEMGDGNKSVIVVRMNRFYESAYAILKEHGLEKFEAWKNSSTVESSHYFYDNLYGLYRQREEEDYISPSLQEYLDSLGKVFVYGKGYYAGLLTKQLMNNGISIAGYILSQKRPEDESDHVYVISEATISDDDFMIVGVGINGYEDILNNLKMYKVKHFVFPFVAEAENSGC